MMPWSDGQQRLLRAMGYVLYAQAPASAPVPPAMTGSAPMNAAGSAADFGRLQRSLQDAAMGHDISTVIADIAALRGNAGAKRALWPKLRALRRPH